MRRRDGQTVQLTELLYVVLSCVDGRRDLEAVAGAVSERIGKRASADDIRFLVDEKLRPLGLLKEPDGTEPPVEKANPLLALRFRLVLSSERATQRLTAPFQPLFLPPVVVVVVAGFFAMTAWLLFDEGLAQGTRQLLYSPGMLLLTFALTALSAGFHEFGHAAACRYGGAKPGVMGAGIYLVWPAFYTDVTDSYRLSRGGRLRTDLGGLYFNMLFALATFGVWSATRYDPLLVLVPLQLFQMVHQLLPFVRLDGYYILADLTGVPDLFSRIRPTLLSMVPGREPEERASALKPWVRVVVTLWVLAVIPILLVMLTLAALGLPRLLATAWDSVGRQWDGVTESFGDGDVLGVLAGALGSVAVMLPVLSILYMLGRLVTRGGRALWQRTDERPLARAALAPLGLALVAALAWLWWPNGEYEPLRRGERWTVQEAVADVRHVPSGRPGLTGEREAELERSAATPDEPPATEPEPTTTTTAPSEDAPVTTEAESPTTTEPDATGTTIDPTTEAPTP